MTRRSALYGKVSLHKLDEDTVVLNVSGNWGLSGNTPTIEEVMQKLEDNRGYTRIVIDTTELHSWDTTLVSFLWKIKSLVDMQGSRVDISRCPAGVRRLLELSRTADMQEAQPRTDGQHGIFYQLGEGVLDYYQGGIETIRFIGEVTKAFGIALTGRARFRAQDLVRHIQRCSVDALPIVTLISFLVGLIFAFIGAIQLRMFGAQIYVANLVGIAMVRVIGAVMTGVIMAGRTGASFAAELGTMQVNDEIDALRTTGISPVEFLVLPRMLAVTLMMPLLCLYADVMGIAGGMFVGVCILDISSIEYYVQTTKAVSLANVWIGLFHSFVFGIIVGMAGCFRGIQCGRSSESVGSAATSAVVTAVLYIVIATAVITFICNVLGI
jgi:phospholipid/cholesterol/gamma-HCH transport system permease protein